MHPNFYCSPVNVFVLWLSGYVLVKVFFVPTQCCGICEKNMIVLVDSNSIVQLPFVSSL